MYKKLLLAGLITLSFSAQSAVISGSHTTAGGKTVALQGLQWLSFDQTWAYSRAQIEGGAGGFLADGWRYATRSELETLFDSLWGGIYEGYHSSNVDGGNWLSENFGDYYNDVSGSTSNGGGNLFFGLDGECHVESTATCRAHWRSDGNGRPGQGWFSSDYGLSFGNLSVNRNHATNKNNNTAYASVLVQEVPLPAAAWLFLSAIGGLGILKRVRK